MRLGSLDRPIIIEQFSSTKSPEGYQIKTWSTYLSIWAELEEAKSGGERYKADELVGKRVVTWRIRYDSGITQKMRINDNGVFYNIIDFHYLDRNGFMRLITATTDSKML